MSTRVHCVPPPGLGKETDDEETDIGTRDDVSAAVIAPDAGRGTDPSGSRQNLTQKNHTITPRPIFPA
jgi:hypothetical protein